MRNKIKPPQQTTVLDRDVIVLRKLDVSMVPDGIYDILAKTNLEPGVQEQQCSWFEDGYVANDHPRDSLVSKILIMATQGFAVARTDTGEILHDFGLDLAGADKAAQGAKIRLDFDVQLPEVEDDIIVDDE